ncbi:hypothetical protein M422DRAFT_269197 [Sphaerobolus stellatus SS14]|uniref:Uncharacterized protein n=1 Tax=Sphaerobolus stellatus (strain SS14) TaxID=990650 RepID=A0A0C9U5D1_SPHS4|nr:hypothetical protein M422DRAFT_269197 [Sphaerobolus stellatus SS14]
MKESRFGAPDSKLALELLSCIQKGLATQQGATDALPRMETRHIPQAPCSTSFDLASLEAAIKASENRIIAEIQSKSGSSLANHYHHDTPPTPRPLPIRPKDNEVVISLAKVAKQHPIRTDTPSVIKAMVEEAFAKSKVPALTGKKLQGVRMRPNGSLVISDLSDEDAIVILRHFDQWLDVLVPGTAILTHTYQVVANFVPVDFDPANSDASKRVFAENMAIFESENQITGLRWLHNHQQSKQPKQHSSLVVAVNNAMVTDKLIRRNLTVLGAICNVQKFVPPPVQCFRCQDFGHSMPRQTRTLKSEMRKMLSQNDDLQGYRVISVR